MKIDIKKQERFSSKEIIVFLIISILAFFILATAALLLYFYAAYEASICFIGILFYIAFIKKSGIGRVEESKFKTKFKELWKR